MQTVLNTMDQNNNKEDANMLQYKVTKRFQVENMRKMIMSEFGEKEKGFAMTNINVKTVKDKSVPGERIVVTKDILRVPSNILTKHLEILDNEVVSIGDGYCVNVSRYTYDLLNVTFVSKSKRITSMYGETLYRVGFGVDEHFYFKKGSSFYDIIEGRTLTKQAAFFNDDKTPKVVRTYSGKKGGQNASASQTRKGSITFMRNNDVDINDILNKVTFGARDIMLNSKVNWAKATKGAVRLNQFQAPSVYNDSKVNSFAVFMGKVRNKAGNDYRDGFGFISCSFMAEALTKASHDKFKFTPESVHGLAFQIRPYLTKIQAECVERAYIDEFIKTRKLEVVHICRNAITPEIQKQYIKAVNGEDSIYSGKLVVLTDKASDNPRIIDVLTDINGLKAPFDLTRESGINMLDMGNARSKANTSTQMLQTLILANKELGMDFITKKSYEYLDNKKQDFFNPEARVPSLSDFGDKFYGVNVINKVAPKVALDYIPKLFRTNADNLYKGSSRDIRRVHFPLDGSTCKIVADSAMDFETMILGVTPEGYAEVYCAAAESYFNENNVPQENWFITGYKYPKMHTSEFLLAKVIGKKEMVDRINAADTLTDHQKWLLRRKYIAMSEAIIAVPAIELYKNMLAGMDFDADAMAVIYEPGYNQIIIDSGLRPISIVITDAGSKGSDEKFKFTSETQYRVFERIITNENKSVGEITNHNDVFVAALLKVKNNEFEDACYILTNAFKDDDPAKKDIRKSVGKGNVYVSPLETKVGDFGIPYVEINEKLTFVICDRIKDMDLEITENYCSALTDLITIGRMLQERTIDSVKTNDEINLPFNFDNLRANNIVSATKDDIGVGFYWG